MMQGEMRFKTILIFLAGIAVGGVFAFVLFGDLSDRRDVPLPPTAGAPEWLAPTAAELQDEAAKASSKSEEKERALIVGVIGPETGVEAKYGLAVLEGVAMAVDSFNIRGGLSGERIEVLHDDSSGGSGQALDIVSTLIEKNVVAIFSAPTGWATFAPTHLANESHTVFISIGTRRNIGRSGDYVFHFSLPDEIAIDDMLAYAVNELGYRDFALVTSSSYDYSLSIASAFKQAVPRHGGKILLEADTYDTFSGKTDIGGVVTALKAGSEGLQAIIFTGDAHEAAQLARAAEHEGLKLPLIGSEDLFSEQFLEQSGQAARGALLYATFAPERDSRLVNDFVTDHVGRKDAVPDRFTALAYDAFGLLSQALEDAGSLKGRAVRDALVSLNETEGVTGASRWAADGTPVKHPYLYRVEGGQTGVRFQLVVRDGE
ncbi:MAG: ABC transporter substrate-binding protein [Alphaproteobacteria bacterium]|nr:ABC transporter substrate-binding protein [Alphaproteobacteria bacterium]